MDWVYFTLSNDEHLYDDLIDPQGRPNHRGWVVPTRGGPLPTLSWEATREGIDDGRYLFTLQSLTETARNHDDPKVTAAARKADDTIRRLHALVDASPFGDRYPFFRTCDDLSVASLDEFRYSVARHIVALQTMLE